MIKFNLPCAKWQSSIAQCPCQNLNYSHKLILNKYNYYFNDLYIKIYTELLYKKCFGV